MNKVYVIIGLIFLIGIGLTFSLNVSAAEDLIPSWIKETAGFWSEDLIDDVTFVNAMEWMIKNGIIVTAELSVVDSSESDDLSDRQVVVPEWIKNNAGFWASDQISDSDFLSGITYLYKEEIVKSPNVVVNKLNPDWTLGPGDYEFSLTSEGLERKYLVHVPPSYDAIKSTPVVFSIHGGGGNGEAFRNQSNMDVNSDKHGYIVVYPDGTGTELFGRKSFTWNSGNFCCGYAVRNNIDDVGFFSKMMDDVETKFNVDKNRIYAAGLSNGGQMTHRLACELSDRIAAIASVAGANESNMSCDLSRSVPVMIIHGTEDQCVPYKGSKQCGGCYSKAIGIDLGDVWPCDSVEQKIEDWKEMNSRSDTSEIVFEKGDVTCIRYGSNDDNSEVVLCTIEGGGHTWPSSIVYKSKMIADISGMITYDISNDQIWEFFERHSLE